MALQSLAQFGCVNQGTVQGFVSTLILASVGIATSSGAAASGGFSGGSSAGAIGVVGSGGIAIAIGGLIAWDVLTQPADTTRDRADATVIPIPRVGEATPSFGTPSPTPTQTPTPSPTPSCPTPRGGGSYPGNFPNISVTRLGVCDPDTTATLLNIATDASFPLYLGSSCPGGVCDDRTFGNRGPGLLPPALPSNEYREYTVPTGIMPRGAKRLVTYGVANRQPSGGIANVYYTNDHYQTFYRVTP